MVWKSNGTASLYNVYNIELWSSLIRSSYVSFAVSDLHFATVYGLRTDLGGCKIRGGRMPPDPPTSFCISRGSSYKHSVPMLCLSNGDVRATPLITFPSNCMLPWSFMRFIVAHEYKHSTITPLLTVKLREKKALHGANYSYTCMVSNSCPQLGWKDVWDISILKLSEVRGREREEELHHIYTL